MLLVYGASRPNTIVIIQTANIHVTIARRKTFAQAALFALRNGVPSGNRPRGGVVTQRPAKPCTPVRVRAWPPKKKR